MLSSLRLAVSISRFDRGLGKPLARSVSWIAGP
jgi:hypothetical protein